MSKTQEVVVVPDPKIQKKTSKAWEWTKRPKGAKTMLEVLKKLPNVRPTV